MTDPKTLARLRELEEKATPAPLKHRWESDGQKPDRYFAHGTHLIETVRDNPVIDNMNVAIMQSLGPQETAANAELFVMLRNAARSLISDAESLAAAEARVKELDAEVERLRPFEPRVLPSNWPHEAKIAHAKGFMEPLVLAFDAMNGECNYTETCVRHGSKEYTVTVRRGDKPTPHELRMAAEARVRELEEAVLELSKGWRWSKSQPDNPIARDAVVQKEVGGC